LLVAHVRPVLAAKTAIVRSSTVENTE